MDVILLNHVGKFSPLVGDKGFQPCVVLVFVEEQISTLFVGIIFYM